MQSKIALFGGSGFVGRHLAAALAAQGWQVNILSRHPERHRELAVTPSVRLREVGWRDDDAVKAALSGCVAAVNLIGILNEGGGSRFQAVHTELPERLARLSQSAGVQRFVQLSALGVGEQAPSRYLRSKTEGEARLRKLADTRFHVSCVRPSVIFGRDDSFINRFAQLLRIAPGVLPLACPDARFAPVWVGDVVQTIIAQLRQRTPDQAVQLCGPDEYRMIELVRQIRDAVRPGLPIIGLNSGLSKLQALMLNIAPGKPFTLDNYRSLQKPSVCGADNDLPRFVAAPTHFASVLAETLGGNDHRQQLARARDLSQ